MIEQLIQTTKNSQLKDAVFVFVAANLLIWAGLMAWKSVKPLVTKKLASPDLEKPNPIGKNKFKAPDRKPGGITSSSSFALSLLTKAPLRMDCFRFQEARRTSLPRLGRANF